MSELNNGPLCYLATPYSKYMGGDLERAFIDAAKLAARLMLSGVKVYSPIAHTHPLAIYGQVDPLDHSIWLPFDEAMMAAADVLIVAHMHGWEESFGVAHEIKFFEDRGKRIFDLDPSTMRMTKREQKVGPRSNVGEQCRRPTEEQLIQLIKKHATSMNGAERIWNWNLEQAISDTARAVLALTAPPGDGCTRSDFHLPLTLKPLADPNHDPGDRVVIDGQGAHIGTISNTELAETAVAAINGLCEDCPPADYPTDETRCEPCLRRSHAGGE